MRRLDTDPKAYVFGTPSGPWRGVSPAAAGLEREVVVSAGAPDQEQAAAETDSVSD